jgi:hypothetical protein
MGQGNGGEASEGMGLPARSSRGLVGGKIGSVPAFTHGFTDHEIGHQGVACNVGAVARDDSALWKEEG